MRLTFFLLGLCALTLVAGSALAAPYRPQNDGDILETLPGGPAAASDRTARALRALSARDPANLDLALRLAGIHLARARSESDPRQLGRAEAVLSPWWNADAPPVPVLVLRATIEQSNHAFADARSHLERALAAEPANAQARLTLASVQEVTGDLDGARANCAELGDVSLALVAVACAASVDGVSGHAQRAYDAIERELARPLRAGAAQTMRLRVWAMTLQAELGERIARTNDAERLYRASLALDARDAYTVAAYADFLIDAGRYDDVLALIPRDTPVDTLLLRRVQAAKRSDAADAGEEGDALGERFAALRARGDRVHLREEARYTLEIRGNPSAALDLALENWRVQKEPLDARIALEAAIAAQRPDAAREVVEWIASSGLEGERLHALVREASR